MTDIEQATALLAEVRAGTRTAEDVAAAFDALMVPILRTEMSECGLLTRPAITLIAESTKLNVPSPAVNQFVAEQMRDIADGMRKYDAAREALRKIEYDQASERLRKRGESA